VVEPRKEIGGTHHPDGVFLAYGKGISKGSTIARRHICDVGATMLYSLGLEVPSDFEGKVPQAMFTAEHLEANPIVIGLPTVGSVKDEGAASMAQDEKEQIMAQLQMLGYME
jgi:hypothetical protein